MFKVIYFPLRILCFDRKSTSIAEKSGWLPGARYNEMRHVRGQSAVGLIDVNWRYYSFVKHLEAVRRKRPLLTVVRDIERHDQLQEVMNQAEQLATYVPLIIVVPKVCGVLGVLSKRLGSKLIAGYSVPTRYGRTNVPKNEFVGYPVHLLGGRPDVQRVLADEFNVISIDSNRLTLDARYGDSFDGVTFRPNSKGGLYTCIKDSIVNINKLWIGYKPKLPKPTHRRIIQWLNKHRLRTTKTKQKGK